MTLSQIITPQLCVKEHAQILCESVPNIKNLYHALLW
jgi:hypothetical protein